jgi:hypothetical protein
MQRNGKKNYKGHIMEHINATQGTPEWFAARLGIPTASNFSTILPSGRGGGESKTRRTYMLKLIGERMTGEMVDSYTNAHMERGKEMESEARFAYEFMRETECQRVGFIKNFGAGASPDSLVGDNGLVEIKTKLPHLQLEVILSDEMPSEHWAQVQGQLWVSEREWCDFVSYWPKLPLFTKRIYRDDKYINQKLWPEVQKFINEMNELQEKIK